MYQSAKILTPYLSDMCMFALDRNRRSWEDQLVYASSAYAIKPNVMDLPILLGILNSKVAQFCLKRIAPVKAGGFALYRAKYLERLPVRVPVGQRELRLADEISNLVERLLEAKEKQEDDTSRVNSMDRFLDGMQLTRLDDYPGIILNISLGKPIQVVRDKTRINLNLVDYVECKDKPTALYVEYLLRSREDSLKESRDLRSDVCKMPIPREKGMVEKIVADYESARSQLKRIPELITNLEEGIDQKVCELYELTSEEVSIIEAALPRDKLS
jgi:hypothetical protein